MISLSDEEWKEKNESVREKKRKSVLNESLKSEDENEKKNDCKDSANSKKKNEDLKRNVRSVKKNDARDENKLKLVSKFRIFILDLENEEC
jgi:hypothetical protein